MDDETRRSGADRQAGCFVQNVFAIETEAAHRRSEWERAIAAAEQRARVRPHNGWERWPQLALWALASVRARATRRVPVPAGNPAGVTCAPALEGGHAPVT